MSWSGQPSANSAARRAPCAAPARAASTRFEGSSTFLPIASKRVGAARAGAAQGARLAAELAEGWPDRLTG